MAGKRIKGSHSSEIHEEAVREATLLGSVTHAGEERARQGRGLDPLVDPKEYGVVRRALNLLVPEEDHFVLEVGIAMPVKSDLDTTGSMGGNVELAFHALPRVQNLLVQGARAMLGRYHVQIATGAVQDRRDMFPYQISQFEPDNEIERQMTLLDPERDGKDATEDYQLGLFSTAYLTETSIQKYGLKGYYFPVGDERGRDYLDADLLIQVFGPTVFEKAFGSLTRPQELPSTDDVAKKVLENWHGFFFQVGDHRHTTHWWTQILGRERVIILPRTEDLAEVQAVVIGLTDGVLDFQSALEFLVQDARVTKAHAQQIIRAVANIPMGAQRRLGNFNHIPMKGAKFASRDDVWPIGVSVEGTLPFVMPSEPATDEINWKL
ncbi:MAG: hypothetical protein U1A25_00510 [Candidatus Sungbacteria bacterium]|nr:hypothetical protein [Candidatus Sungbacteria bacterium]